MMRFDNNEKGMALITVLVAMMIITILLFEFQYTTMVERKLAYNDLNTIQANYLAKSGVMMGLLRVGMYARMLNDPTISKLIKSYPQIENYVNKVWQLPLPDFPPPLEVIEQMAQQDKASAQKVLEQTKIEGSYSHSIQTKSGKINLNIIDTRKDKQEPLQIETCRFAFCHTARMLYNLVSEILTNTDDPLAEFGNIKPEEVVFQIMDWVNEGDESYSRGSKDQHYQEEDPPYKAKRNIFFSLDELIFIKSMFNDDGMARLYQKLLPYVTVYPEQGKINVNEASAQVLKSLDPEFTDQDIDLIMEYRAENALNGGFGSAKAFYDFVVTSLGRRSFAEIYGQDMNDLPFGVGAQNFVVTGAGMLQKSASVFQKKLRVEVSLIKKSRAGELVKGVTTKAACENLTGTFYTDPQICRYCPESKEDCEGDRVLGVWKKNPNGIFACQVGSAFICENTGGSGSSSSSSSTSQQTIFIPNAMKVLTWTEL